MMSNTKSKMLTGLLVSLVILISATPVYAVPATLTDGPYSDSITMTTTDWGQTLPIPKFDSSLGILQSIKLTLAGQVQGDASYENLGAGPASVTLSLQAALKLQRPDGSVLAEIIPLASITANPSAYDGSINFAGSSGGTYIGLSDSITEISTITNPADLALFTGPGTIDLGFSATGSSTGTGAGNLITSFSTKAAGQVEVVYEYTTIPEPATMGLLALGGLLLRRKRK